MELYSSNGQKQMEFSNEEFVEGNYVKELITSSMGAGFYLLYTHVYESGDQKSTIFIHRIFLQ